MLLLLKKAVFNNIYIITLKLVQIISINSILNFKEAIMRSMLKDIAVLLFAAGDEIEYKAKKFKEEREKRYRDFEQRMENKKNEFMSHAGYASKDDFETIMKKIDELNLKIDALKK